MPAMTTTPNSADPTSIDGLKAPSAAVVSAADAQAAAADAGLGLVQQARLSNQNRAFTLAAATYGRESPQAKAAAQAVTATTAAAQRLAVVRQRLDTPAPTVAAAGWALQGRVYSSDLKPQAGHVVFLVDAQKNYLSEYGFAYTDETGYFLLSFGGAGAAQKAAAATSAAEPAAAAGTANAAAPVQLFLEIADAKANPVLLSQTPFVPVAGSASYQAVTLPAGGKPLGDPTPAIRNIAFPRVNKSS
jgi:hypothetical protein